MKNLLTRFAAYNLWANQAFAACVQQLPPALQMQEINSSFPGLHATVLHLWDAESIWWQRMKLQEKIIRPSTTFTGNTEAVTKGLLEQSKQWADWVQAAQEHMLEHEFIYRDSKREIFKQPVAHVLLHLFNHSTYHRGQLVTMLRQLDITTIPNTDFIAWSRNRNFKE